MPVFINVRFEEAGTALIAALRKADRSVEEYAAWLGYPAHLTLVQLEKEAAVDSLVGCAEQLARALRDVSIDLGALGLFAGESPVVWLSPVPSVALLEAHRQLYAALEDVGVHAHYRPGNWMPHVTLAAGQNLVQTADAISALIPMFTPIRTRPSAVDIVSFPPATVLWTCSIG